MPRIKPILQHGQSECGAACLAAVAAYYGLRLPLARIREYASTGRSGTSVMGLTIAAEKIGMVAKGVKGPPESIQAAPLPCIAHVILKNRIQHFVVLTSCGTRRIRMMDPAYGEMKTVTMEDFLSLWTGVLVILAPAVGFVKGNMKVPVVSRYLQLVRPFRKVILQSMAGSLVYSLLGLSTAIYVQKIMDFVLTAQNLNLLNLMSLIMVLLLVMRNLIGYLKNLFLLKTGAQIDSGLLMGYYRHILSLPQRFFDSMKTGEILSRMGDALKIRYFINQTIIDLTVGITSIILSLLAMAILSRKLCLLVLTAIPVHAFIIWLYDRFNRVILRKTMENAAEFEAQMVESISLSQTVREFNLQKYCMGRTEEPFVNFLRSGYLAGRAAIRSRQAAELITGLLTVILLWTGSSLVCRQYLSPGELMSFYALMGYLAGPVATLTGSGKSFRDAGIASDRLFQVMDRDGERNADTGFRIGKFNGAMEFRNVNFRYDAGPLLFRNLSFTLQAGSYTGIAGKNGCGKSSLVALILALYIPENGKILLDGHDTRLVSTRDLRRLISVVPQHPDLFSGTLLENIAPGEKQPDMQKILELAGNTGLNPMLEKMPDGVCTRVGERGFSLSGGERQRMAVVRALYRDPSILILDEATTAMDPQSEEKLFTLLEGYRHRGMTLIIVSHKLSSIVPADRILFLDRGIVAEQGTHAELVRRKGAYFAYLNLQNGF